MNAQERAGKLFEAAERRGDAPTEKEVWEAIVDAESDKEEGFTYWLLTVDPKMAKRYENERELAMLENHEA